MSQPKKKLNQVANIIYWLITCRYNVVIENDFFLLYARCFSINSSFHIFASFHFISFVKHTHTLRERLYVSVMIETRKKGIKNWQNKIDNDV